MDFLAIGNDQLDAKESVSEGDLIHCKKCKRKHKLEGSEDGQGKRGNLLFYTCKKKTYLYAIGHRKIMFKEGK